MAELGFVYQGMGRGYNGSGRTEWERQSLIKFEMTALEVEEPV